MALKAAVKTSALLNLWCCCRPFSQIISVTLFCPFREHMRKKSLGKGRVDEEKQRKEGRKMRKDDLKKLES